MTPEEARTIKLAWAIGETVQYRRAPYAAGNKGWMKGGIVKMLGRVPPEELL